MSLPPPARALVAGAVAAGGAVAAWAGIHAARGPGLDGTQLAVDLVFGLALAAAWVWPLRIFRDGNSEALHVDEGFFVLLALLLPAWAVLLTFAAATSAAQLVRRRPVVKSAFNTGQVLASAAAGLAVIDHLGPGAGPVTPGRLGAAALGACMYLVVNTAAFVAVMATMDTPVRRSLVEGAGVRLILVTVGVVIGLVAALAVQGRGWAVPLTAVPFVLLPQVLSGHFKARRDRTRLRGLFEATLEANRGGDAERIRRIVTAAARRELACGEAWFGRPRPGDGLSTSLLVNGQQEHLSVSRAGRTAPFDDEDEALLGALAAVSATALTNASLYRETRRQQESLAAITSSLGEGVCALSPGGTVTFLNPAAADMLGWPAGTATGAPADPAGPATAPAFLLLPGLQAMEGGARITSYDSRFYRADGSEFDVAYTATPLAGREGADGAVIVFRDISERKRFEEQLSRFAFHDPLTGLANRRLFVDHLRNALERSRRSGERHAVLFADIDRFKLVNDGLGHQAGDQLLAAVASCMQEAVRPGDVLARFGGDEFTILLQGVTHERDAVAAARRIAELLRAPITLPDGHEVVVTVSIGIAVNSPGDSGDDVLRNADVAMYAAKRRGRVGAYQVFDGKEMGLRSSDRLEMEADLRRALGRGEIEAWFQPVTSAATGEVCGAEALIRWRHPVRGLLSPAEFVPLAEESGLILPLGRFMLEESCRWARRWREEHGTRLSISVNLSGRQFSHADLELDVSRILAETGTDPRQLCLEITESIAVDDMARTDQILRGLRRLGVTVAIDDFGTGYSSLAYLNRFPVDVVKIDQVFVRRLADDPVSAAIVSAVITLSGAIDATTVAEGVETVEQLERLRDLGCPLVQGYLVARPMPAEDLGEFLADRAGVRPSGRALPCPQR